MNFKKLVLITVLGFSKRISFTVLALLFLTANSIAMEQPNSSEKLNEIISFVGEHKGKIALGIGGVLLCASLAQRYYRGFSKPVKAREYSDTQEYHSEVRPLSDVQILEVVRSRFPEIFADIPEPLHPQILDYIKNYCGQRPVIEALQEISNSDDASETYKRLKLAALGPIFGFESLRSTCGYFAIFRTPGSSFEERKKADDAASLSHRIGAGQAILVQNMRRQFANDELSRLAIMRAEETATREINTLVKCYKIHLMPNDSVSPNKILYSILLAYNNDPSLKDLIPIFKVAYKPLPPLGQQGGVLPKVVFYCKLGKENVQLALNKLYNYFKQNPEITGSGQRPRYNAKVNDLIWVAQGHGDYKTDDYAQYYEPSRYYYRQDITGRVENYHIIHPETGQELVN